jgi:hypothetical protein
MFMDIHPANLNGFLIRRLRSVNFFIMTPVTSTAKRFLKRDVEPERKR